VTANGGTASWWARRLATWPWRIGLGVPLLAGAVLAIGAVVSLTSGGYEPPKTLDAGPADQLTPGAPKLFEEEDVWLVRLAGSDFVALYDRGLQSKCPLQWRREFEFMGRTGWFEDTCNGYAYDLAGRCFSDACRGALLDHFNVAVTGGNVIVDLRALQSPAPADPLATPLTPPIQ
jgi:hypothetical protein